MSDLHGSLPAITTNDYDVAIVAGDICPDFPYSGGIEANRQAIWMSNHVEPWMPRDCYMTYGNHDIVGRDCPDWITESVRKRLIVDDEVSIGGKRIWFSPWSNEYGHHWAFMKHPQKLAPMYEAIPDGIDVLVTHGPAFRLGDSEPPHCFEAGSKELLRAIDRIQPAVVICGHIHGGRGIYKRGRTLIYNVAIMDRAYQPTGTPVLIDTEVDLTVDIPGLICHT